MKMLLSFLILNVIYTMLSACPISPSELRQKLQDAKSSKMRPDISVAYNNLTQVEFDEVVKRIKDHFTPIFLAEGRILNVYSSWDFPMNNAFATRDELGSNIYLFGLFTMNRYMTKDSFLFVACHEIGHHLGGYPKNPKLNPWSSVEGEADYFATTKCYREILKNDSLNADADKLDLPEEVKSQCKTQFPEDDDYRICLRSSRAAEDVGKMMDFMLTETEKKEIFLLQPEPAAASETLITHPAPLCRTHTIREASLCNRPSDIAIGETDETVGVCHKKNGDNVGNRAQCWFKSKEDAPTSVMLIN